MKLKSLFLTLLVMFASVAMAQVETGKVYRIVSAKYGTVISANPITNKLTCVSKGTESDYQQMWKFTATNNGKYYIQNLFSQRYIQNEEGRNVLFKTDIDPVAFAVRVNDTYNEPGKELYNIDATNRAGGWGMHCDGSSNVVPWSDGPDAGEISGTEWTFEEINISKQEEEQAHKDYLAYNSVFENKATIIEKVNELFADSAATVLKPKYAEKSDDEIKELLEGVPANLQEAILKIKNNSWEPAERENLSEKAFRVYEYYPYSDTQKWTEILYHRYFNRVNNPTGICTKNDKDIIYVFVDSIPEGTTISIEEISSTGFWGNETQLTAGLNIIPSSSEDGFLYVRYLCDTHTGFDVDKKEGPKELSDYPRIKVHIEGGYVNGFWSKERGHTNEDWVYMRDNMFKNPMAIQAVGDHSMLNFRTYEFLKECPDNIAGVMKLWDFWNERQRFYMGLNKYYRWFNNKQLAMSDDNGFMDASNYRTHYNNNTLGTIVNYDLLIRDGGSTWGPLHEIGHTNQYAFEIVGTSEVSNNALANFTLFDIGTHTSRGANWNDQVLDFENNIPYVLRGEKEYGQKLFSMTRMYFQLFLYFHAAGKNPEFYPNLFEELRKDKLVGWSTSARDEIDPKTGLYIGSMDATNDQLKFVEKCCSIAQMDLTEFFEAWGFFIPMENDFVGDYGHHYVYLYQDSINACKARIKAANYEKKGGHLMFLEDRIRKSNKMLSEINNDDTGYRLDYSNEILAGKVGTWGHPGFLGQWGDYIDEDVEAAGYYYSVSNNNELTITQETGVAKGALGFKVYDADNGELLTYTNSYSRKIPNKHANKNFKVVAAQANGEDYIVPHISQAPESMQRTSLNKTLTSTYKFINNLKNENGKIVGKIYPDSIANLEKIYKEAKDAYNNKDISKYSYAEWGVMLDNECKRLQNTDGTRLLFEEGMRVYIYPKEDQEDPKDQEEKSKRYLSAGSPAVCSTSQSARSLWTIEYTGEKDVYYLKSADGKYINDFEAGLDEYIYADTDQKAIAARFKVNYDLEGYIYFTNANKEGDIYLGLTNIDASSNGFSGKQVKGMNAFEDACNWIVEVYENNSAEFYTEELNSIMAEAELVIKEVLNVDSINTMNIFNNTVIVKNRDLENYIKELYYHDIDVKENIENVANHKSYLNTYRSLLNDIADKYIVSTPIATKDKTIAWYRLYEAESNKYLSASKSTGSNAKRLTTVSYSGLDARAKWAFVPTGRPNEFKVYNSEFQGYISKKDGARQTYLYAVKDDIMPMTVTYNDKKIAIELRSDNGNININKSYVDLSFTDATAWQLELVEIEVNEELANDIITNVEVVVEEINNNNEDCYDMSGRKVVNPERGLYIQNGKKVIVK